MSKSHRTTKNMKTKSRKRKIRDLDIEEEKIDSKIKTSTKKSHFEKVKEDDFDENKLINEFLPEEAVKHYHLISKLINEFNCNSNDMKIYCRNYEKSQIKEYILENKKEGKSGLMYVCGHPGTGKSSIIRVILKEFEEEMMKNSKLKEELQIFNYNGMIFKKLYDFSLQLIKDIRLDFKNKSNKLESKLKLTDDVIDLGNRIQKYFLKFKNKHKLVIIDEVDNLSMTESARNFVAFLHSILKSDTNTTIIGIANSVDLLSKVCQYNSKEMDLVEK